MKKYFILLLIVQSVCIVNSVRAENGWELGGYTFLDQGAKPLVVSTPLAESLGNFPSPDFVRRVGGVAFDSVATPENIKITTLSLEYKPNRRNGKRLIVAINGKSYEPLLYDWQLIPIAKFSNSNYSAAFTLFGELNDSAEQEKIIRNGDRVLNYAPSFKNTLLGLRLFQLDVLLVDRRLATGVPKYNGQYVLGEGEKKPDIAAEAVAREAYYFAIADNLEQEKFNSYVICDCQKDVFFGIENDSFYLSGEPYYYFWITTYDKILAEQAIRIAKRMRILSDSGNYEQLIYLLPKIDSYKKRQFDEELAIAMDSIETDESAHYLKQYSQRRNMLNPLLYGMNPNVWEAGRVTMRWSAFFRYVRRNHGDKWNEFFDKILVVEIKPDIKTPTVMVGPN
jgi:hypothetical protein